MSSCESTSFRSSFLISSLLDMKPKTVEPEEEEEEDEEEVEIDEDDDECSTSEFTSENDMDNIGASSSNEGNPPMQAIVNNADKIAQIIKRNNHQFMKPEMLFPFEFTKHLQLVQHTLQMNALSNLGKTLSLSPFMPPIIKTLPAMHPKREAPKRVPNEATSRANIKKYRCDICDKTFSRSNTLITHKRIHTGEKPFKCEHCGRAFRQPGNLTRHRLTHTTVKPYVCGLCDKAFNRASNLHTHMRTHSQL